MPNLTGLAANDPVPGHYFEVAFAQGEPSLGTNTLAVLFMGNSTSSGSATQDTVIYGPTSSPPLASENDAITLFGVGSELHRMVKFFLKVNNTTPFYAVAVTRSAGTQATRDHVITTTATGDGTIRWYVCGEFVESGITSGDIVQTMVDNSVTAINRAALANGWPIQASNVTNTTVRLTARIAGPRGNWLRSGVTITAGIGTAVSNSTHGFFTSGATADSNTTALSTILPYRYYYIVSAANDATQFGALKTQVDTQAAPVTGIRQRPVTASNDTLANCTTLATGINAARAAIIHLAQGDWEPCVLAAYVVGVISYFEAPFPWRLNFCSFGNDALTSAYWQVPAPLSGAAPTRANIVSALNNGITPIAVNANKTTYLVDLITTRSLNGSTPDYRIRDWHKVTVCDRYADDLGTKFNSQFNGKVIANDPPQGRAPNPGTVSPRQVRAAIEKLTREYGDLSLVQNVDAINAATVCQRDTSPTTSISSSIPLQPSDILKRTATFIGQVA